MARIKASTVRHSDIGRGKKGIGLGLGKSKTAKRHRARRGGVKRISGGIYPTIRQALKSRLEELLKDICAIVEGSHPKRKTVATTDIVFVLRRKGTPIYGFGNPETKVLR